MVNAPNPQTQSLMDLVGRNWQLGAPVADACFDFMERNVAFLTGEGVVMIAPASDPEPVSKRARIQSDTSRITIAPRLEKPKPLVGVSAPEGSFSIVVASPGGGFVGATILGSLFKIDGDGTCALFGSDSFAEPKALVSNEKNNRIAVLSGDTLAVLGADGTIIGSVRTDNGASDIAFSPDGTRVAICDDAGVVIHKISGDGISEDSRLSRDGSHVCVAWSPSGRFITVASVDCGLYTWRLFDKRGIDMSGYPSVSAHFNWGPSDAFLATSGAYRNICWPLDDRAFATDKPKPLETGMKGVVMVSAIAAQRKRDLVAAGFGNGIVVVGQAGKPDELVVRGAEGDAVNIIAWAKDGLGLVIGTQDGFATLLTFPDFMFK